MAIADEIARDIREGTFSEKNGDFVQKLTDHAALIRKMDAIANADRSVQTNDATAVLLDKAAKIITLYRARYPERRKSE